MSDTTSTLLGVAALGGAAYVAHRWLSGREAEAATEPTVNDAVPIDPAPVSSPSQADPKPTRPTSNDAALSRAFDPIFASQGRGVPIAFLRALAGRESNLNPNLTDGPAWGLLQVTEIVRRDYNRRHGTRFLRVDLLNPPINVAIAADALRTIVASYRRFHPEVVNLQENWNNPRFVELLSFSWAAGFSQRAGVGRVVRYLRDLGFTEITLDMVFAHAAAAGASRHLSHEDKVRFAKSVARLYQRERDTPIARVA